jgi:predicted ABC-type ATPase
MSKRPLQPQTPTHSVIHGDEIYFQHARHGPLTGRVVAVGRDGCQVAHELAGEAKYLPVTWDAIHGHKARAQRQFVLVDQGEDGAIVEDETGQRAFLRGELPAEDDPDEPVDEPVRKACGHPVEDRLPRLDAPRPSCPPRPPMPKPIPLLFLKSGIANRPGLSLRDTTDKAGHRTKRWMRTADDAPKPKPGKTADPDPRDQRGAAHGYGTHDIRVGGRVKFKAGAHAGRGEITAVGKDGVTVKDAEGREHGIHHHELTHYAPSDEQRGGGQQPPGKPPVSAGGEGQAEPQEPKKPSTVLGKQDPIPAESFVAADYAKSHDQADVTPESIIAGFPPDTKDRIQAAQDRLKGIEETIKEFKKDGRYNAQREIVHSKIKADILSPERVKAATPAEGEKPTFMILGGRGGSGKSSFNGLVYDPDKFIVLDADFIKEQLPEYEGWNAYQVHEESSDLFDEITDLAQALGLNIVHDATMKTSKKAVALVNRFKDAGYRTEAHYMHLPRQESAKRAVNRFLRGGEKGRYVPVDVILSNTTNEASFDQVKGLVDRWSFRDNNVPKGGQPILISESGDAGKPSEKTDSPMRKSMNALQKRRIIPLLLRRI